jgi:hypothetical protein
MHLLSMLTTVETERESSSDCSYYQFLVRTMYGKFYNGSSYRPSSVLPSLLALGHTIGLHLLLSYRVGVIHLLAFSS